MFKQKERESLVTGIDSRFGEFAPTVSFVRVAEQLQRKSLLDRIGEAKNNINLDKMREHVISGGKFIRERTGDLVISAAVGGAVRSGIKHGAEVAGIAGPIAAFAAGAATAAFLEGDRQYKAETGSHIFTDILKMKVNRNVEFNNRKLVSAAVIGGVSGVVGGALLGAAAEALAQTEAGHAVIDSIQRIAGHAKDQLGSIRFGIGTTGVASAQVIQVDDVKVSVDHLSKYPGVFVTDVKVPVDSISSPVIEFLPNDPPVTEITERLVTMPSEIPLQIGSNPYNTSEVILQELLGYDPNETDVMELTMALKDSSGFSMESAKQLQPGFRFMINDHVNSIANGIVNRYLLNS